MVASAILRLSVCFLLLGVFLPGFDAQFYTTTPSYWPYYTTNRGRPNSYNCGPSEFDDPMGNITSPNYPNPYNNSQFCTYLIVAPSLSTMNFTIRALDLETNFNCTFDWIEFTCQSNSVSRTIKFCGVGNRSEISFKPCSRALMRFISDGSTVGLGFFVTYDIKPISCQGNCTPVAIGAGYNCTCDANQTNPYIAPPYDKCPVDCHLAGSPDGYTTYCACNISNAYRPPPTVTPCPDGCYQYFDTFGYPVCYCNTTAAPTRPPLECPYGCYIGQDNYGYPICRCEGTTQSTPCPFGCYNVTYYYGNSRCECSTPESTTPLTIYCPSGCTQDKDYWGTPYCRCNSSYTTTTPYPIRPTTPSSCYPPCYYQYNDYGSPYCVCGTNTRNPSYTTEMPCYSPCYWIYNNQTTNGRYCTCGMSTTVAPCYSPCRYEYDFYGRQYCSCNQPTSPRYDCFPPCYYAYDYNYNTICRCDYMSTTDRRPVTTPSVAPCYSPCRYEYDFYGRQYCSCNQPTSPRNDCFPPCYYGYDDNWNTICRCDYMTTTDRPITTPSVCNTTTSSSMGSLASPNYPNAYPVGVDCVQSITVPMANSIQLTFTLLNLYFQSAENCLNDWVQVTGCDGSVKQYCSPNSTYMTIDFICTVSHTVTVYFHSGYYNYYSYKGFQLKYRSTLGSSCNSTGGLVSLGSRGNIVSPYYPASYPLSNDCYYVLQAEDRQMTRIRVAFELLKMQDSYGLCSVDYIKLNCLDGSGSPWYVCGTRIPMPVTFNCSSVEIQFHSEIPPSADRSPRQFKIVYYGVEGPASSAVSLRSRLGLSGAGGAGSVLLILFVALAMKLSG